MRQNNFLAFITVLCIQLLIGNYFHVSAYLTLSLLPCLILMLPARIGPIQAMFIAFLAGLTVDVLAEGVAGLNALALVPAGASRNLLTGLIFGNEMKTDGEDISVSKHGHLKTVSAILIVQAIFLIIYIWADGAGARPLYFNVIRFVVSIVAGTAASVIMANMLDSRERR